MVQPMILHQRSLVLSHLKLGKQAEASRFMESRSSGHTSLEHFCGCSWVEHLSVLEVVGMNPPC